MVFTSATLDSINYLMLPSTPSNQASQTQLLRPRRRSAQPQ